MKENRITFLPIQFPHANTEPFQEHLHLAGSEDSPFILVNMTHAVGKMAA